MRAAVVFYDQYSLSRDGDDDNAGYDRQCYAAAREAGADTVLLSCANGNEGALAAAVLPLTPHHMRSVRAESALTLS